MSNQVVPGLKTVNKMFKSISFTFASAYRKYFAVEANPDVRILFFVLIIPLTCMLFLLQWEPQILVFVFLGYTSAVIGFIFAKSTLVRDQLLSEEDQLYRMMVNYIGDVVIVHRMEDHSNVFVSPSIESVLGFSPDEIICKYGTFLIHPEDRKQLIQALRIESLERNPAFTITLRVQQKAGQFLWMELSGKAIVDPELDTISYTILSFRDATERKEIEEATRYFAEELMRKNENTFAPIPDDRQFNTLMASHDLKEPLRTMCSYIDLLDQKYKHQLDLSGRECLSYIKDGAERMNNMLDEVLLFSSMGEETTQIEKTDLKQVLNQVLIDLGPKIARSNTLISCESLPHINVDPRQFEHLLSNLLENAIKYSNQNNPLIEIYWEKKEGYWQFSVRDNGIGVPKEFQKEIFEMFRRLHSVAEFGGSGIGLAICKRIITNHGGDIWVESSENTTGSVFHFTIPVRARTINLATKQTVKPQSSNLVKQFQ